MSHIFKVIILIISVIVITIEIIHLYKSEKSNIKINEYNVIKNTIEEETFNNEVLDEEAVTQSYTVSDGNTYEIVAILRIPTLGIEYPVLSSASEELLKVSLNKYWGPNPNRVGNFCIIGHNYNDEKFFGKLHNIEIGHFIQLTDMSGKTIQYKVYDTYTVNPDDTSCTSQLTDGKKEITLITCTRDFKQRFIVKAREE